MLTLQRSGEMPPEFPMPAVRDLLTLVASGLSREQTARRLGCAPDTVEQELSLILEKLAARGSS